MLVCTLVALATTRYPPAAIMLAATVSLLVVGVIDAGQAFAGFANAAPLTVAALYVIARAAQKTGMMTPLTGRLLGNHRGPMAVTRLVVPSAAASAFLNNTPLVAMLIPDVLAWSRRQHLSASKFLLPLSYATILGGTVTVLGTSTTLVVSGLVEDRGQEPFGVFEVTKVGGPVALAGLATLVLVAARLVPARMSAPERAEEQVGEYTVSMEVVPGGPIDGSTVTGASLRDLDGVYLVELERGGETITPPNPDVVLRGSDRLTFAGRVDQILDLQQTRGLRSAEQEHLIDLDSPRHTFFEAVIGRSSRLSGQTLKEARFRSRYQAAVIGIQRDGQRVDAKLGDVRLRPTDTLLVLARPGFAQRWRSNTDFLVVAHVGGTPPGMTRRAPLVGLVTVAMVAVAALGILPILSCGAGGCGHPGRSEGPDLRRGARRGRPGRDRADRRRVRTGCSDRQQRAGGHRGERLHRCAVVVRDHRHRAGHRALDGGAHRGRHQQRSCCGRAADRAVHRVGGRTRPTHRGHRGGHRRLGVVPDTDRVPDQHHGLRARRLPIHRLRTLGRGADRGRRRGHHHDHGG